jgi:hypothetical protein
MSDLFRIICVFIAWTWPTENIEVRKGEQETTVVWRTFPSLTRLTLDTVPLSTCT